MISTELNLLSIRIMNPSCPYVIFSNCQTIINSFFLNMLDLNSKYPDMVANNLDPYVPTHPGELLKEEIEYRKLSQKQLAADMGVAYTVLNDIVNGKRAVNTKFALLCEAALGIPAHILLGLQAEYDMQTAKRDKSFLEKLSSVRKIVAAVL